MSIVSYLAEPYLQYGFMRRALIACIVLAMSGAPLGFFMNQRRMALVSDAMSHAIFPGVAIAFLVSGLSVWSMTAGGLIAGVLIALLSVFLSRYTQIKEDGVFTLLFLLSLTGGIVLLSLKGSNIDLLHILFGDILAIDNDALLFIGIVAAVTLFALAFIYRGLVIDCFDPDFLMASSTRRPAARLVRPMFFVLFVVNLVAAFQALGTLMALGLILLPAIAAQFWVRQVDGAIMTAFGIAVASSYAGLLISYYTNTPSGPVVVLLCGTICLSSVLLGRYGSFLAGLRRPD